MHVVLTLGFSLTLLVKVLMLCQIIILRIDSIVMIKVLVSSPQLDQMGLLWDVQVVI